MANLDLEQVTTTRFMNPRLVMGERISEATNFFAVGDLMDLLRGNAYSEKNTFNNHVSFVLTHAEAVALTTGNSLTWTHCYATSPEAAMKAVCERNDAVLKYLENFAKDAGCVFNRLGNGIVVDHYVQNYPQAA